MGGREDKKSVINIYINSCLYLESCKHEWRYGSGVGLCTSIFKQSVTKISLQGEIKSYFQIICVH